MMADFAHIPNCMEDGPVLTGIATSSPVKTGSSINITLKGNRFTTSPFPIMQAALKKTMQGQTIQFNTTTISVRDDKTLELTFKDVNGVQGKFSAILMSGNNCTSTLENAVTLYTGVPSFQAQIPDINMRNITAPTALALRDINNDGMADLIVTNDGSPGTVSIQYSQGSLSFSSTIPYSTGFSPKFVNIGDLDNDTLPDIIVANSMDASFPVSIYLNSDLSTIKGASLTTKVGNPQVPIKAAIAGDFNADGLLDLLVNDANSGTVWFQSSTRPMGQKVAFSNQTGSFTYSGAQANTVADLDGDGNPDVPVLIPPSNIVDIVFSQRNNGMLKFSQLSSPIAIGSMPRSMVIGNFVSHPPKTLLDLVVANSGGNTINLVYAIGTRMYATGQPISVGANPSSIVAGDFDGDENLDIAVANSGTSDIWILFGTGDGSLTMPFKVSTTNPNANPPWDATQPCAIDAGDFDGDGRLDIGVVNCNYKAMSPNKCIVFRNTST